MPILQRVETMLGNAELGQLLQVSRQRVSQLVSTPDFPRPRYSLAMGNIWALSEVMAWAEKKGRSTNPDALIPRPEPDQK